MKKKRLLPLMMVAGLCISAVSVSAQTPPDCKNTEWEVLKLTNQHRLDHGLTPYTTFSSLQKAAHTRAEELTIRYAQDHSRPDGSSCFTVLNEYGIAYWTAGENIAAGYGSPKAVVNGWWNSPGHKANMLDGHFSHMGVGQAMDPDSAYGMYWSENFVGGCGYSSLQVQVPEEGLQVTAGTTIDDMDLVAEAVCSHGTTYLPVDGELCEGYRPTAAGKTQEVTLHFGGRSTTFPVTVRKALDKTALKVSRAEATPKKVSLAWKTVEGADGYGVYRKMAGESKYKLIRNTAKLNYTDKSVLPGKTYYYKVRAYQKAEDGYLHANAGVTAKVSTAPGKTSFTKVTPGKKQVRMTWTPVTDADGYEIWYRTGKASYKKARNLLSGEILSAGHYQLKAGTSYTYKIRAFCLENGKRVYGSYSPTRTVTVKK